MKLQDQKLILDRYVLLGTIKDDPVQSCTIEAFESNGYGFIENEDYPFMTAEIRWDGQMICDFGSSEEYFHDMQEIVIYGEVIKEIYKFAGELLPDCEYLHMAIKCERRI